MFNLVSRTSASATNGVEFLGLGSSQSKGIESIDAHAVHVAETRHVEPAHNDEISEDQDGALEIVTLSFAVDIRQ